MPETARVQTVPARHLRIVAGAAATLIALMVPSGAHADLRLCNRTSYVLDLAIALEDKGAVATRGWFRVDPGQCRAVLSGTIEAESIYVHGRAPQLYGPSPLPQSGNAELCVADGNFVIAGARSCIARNGQRLVQFTAIKPAESDQGLSANVAEPAAYTEEQARFAGIQRLLVIAGYDANPVDGIEGAKTAAALAQFLKDRGLPAEAATQATFFDVLIEAAKEVRSGGFSWCNDTALTVMAAVGFEDGGAVVTRGWYRVEPGACMRPELSGQQQRVYSFGEAVDKDGQAVKRNGVPLAWGGAKMLCTQPVRFELTDQADCTGKGLNATGFATIDLADRGSATVRFREP